MALRKLAIIDIGSKTVRLSIYVRITSDQVEEIKKKKVSLRLSEHVENGSLSKEGIRLLIEVLQEYKKTIESEQVDIVDCIATAAIRNAKNQKEVLSTISEHTALSIQLLSGEMEAQYGLLAITQSLAISDGIAIDLGGGSTEITLFQQRKMIQTVSIPFGVVTLSKRFSDGLPMSAEAMDQLSAYVKQEIAALNWIADQKLPIIGIGGSVRLIGKYSLRQKQSTQDLNGYSLKTEEVDLSLKDMRNMNADELVKWANENADLAMPALIVLSELMRYTDSQQLICCTRGIKDGMIYAKMAD